MLQSTPTTANALGGIFLILALVLLGMSPEKGQTFIRMVGAFMLTALAWIMLGLLVPRALAFATQVGFTFGFLSADIVGWRHVRSLRK